MQGEVVEKASQHVALLLNQYEQEWAEKLAQFEERLQLLQHIKHGMELLLLTGSYLIYYFLDCIEIVMAMPPPIGR